jgi:hypothetical protein
MITRVWSNGFRGPPPDKNAQDSVDTINAIELEFLDQRVQQTYDQYVEMYVESGDYQWLDKALGLVQ